MQPEVRPSKGRKFFRWMLRLVGVSLILAVVLVLFWLRGALYNHFIRYPREEAAWQAIRAEHHPVTNNAGWQEFRGILHSHSEHSHDCEVPFEGILRVLKATQLDFICMSDHCVEGQADFKLQWRGLHEGKLFIPGFEMKEGIMPFGVATGLVLSNQTDSALLARQIVDGGGVLFYAHPEEPRVWDRPELTGMEIYNLHTDFKRVRGGLAAVLPDVILNLRRYPEHIYHRMLTRPTEFLKRWDDLNRTRDITGIAGNDCHQNVGYRAFYTEAGTIRMEDTSPETLKEFHLNWLTRPLARLAFGLLEPGRKLFHVQLDPYERSARFVNTHILARELSEPAILESLREGRVYIGFDMMADSAGFRWFAENAKGLAVMGEALSPSEGTQLHALSPLPCRFTVVKDGDAVYQAEGRVLEWRPSGPGKYRVEAELRICEEWVPWVYTNPVQLR